MQKSVCGISAENFKDITMYEMIRLEFYNTSHAMLDFEYTGNKLINRLASCLLFWFDDTRMRDITDAYEHTGYGDHLYEGLVKQVLFKMLKSHIQALEDDEHYDSWNISEDLYVLISMYEHSLQIQGTMDLCRSRYRDVLTRTKYLHNEYNLFGGGSLNSISANFDDFCARMYDNTEELQAKFMACKDYDRKICQSLCMKLVVYWLDLKYDGSQPSNTILQSVLDTANSIKQLHG